MTILRHIEILAESVGRISSTNLPKIEAHLDKLNITLASFLTDPGLLMKFLSDQVNYWHWYFYLLTYSLYPTELYCTYTVE